MIVPGAMMIEPTESESREELDLLIDALKQIARRPWRILNWCRRRRTRRGCGGWMRRRQRENRCCGGRDRRRMFW